VSRVRWSVSGSGQSISWLNSRSLLLDSQSVISDGWSLRPHGQSPRPDIRSQGLVSRSLELDNRSLELNSQSLGSDSQTLGPESRSQELDISEAGQLLSGAGWSIFWAGQLKYCCYKTGFAVFKLINKHYSSVLCPRISFYGGLMAYVHQRDFLSLITAR